MAGSDQNSEDSTDMTQKQEDTDADTFSSGDPVENPDELLPPVLKLEKYASSDIVFNRQMVARNLLETLRVVAGETEDVSRVVNVFCNLAEDYEPSVRAELMQQVPHISAFFNEFREDFGQYIQLYIAPMIVKYLTDTSNQVRKTCQSSILLMVEQGLFDIGTLEEKVCPRVLQLTESSYMDDLRTEAVTLLSKLSSLLGKFLTEEMFLERYIALCLDTSFHVRKVCADNFGEICTIVEQETTESILLPKFYLLCEDSVWGVRKVCAEVFVPVSCVCSMSTRHKVLASVYMNLLSDQSRWVRMAAFQALGPFISTFAEPSKTGLYYSKEGTLTIVDVPENDSFEGLKSPLSSSNIDEEQESNEASLNLDFVINSCDGVVPPHNSSKDDNSCIQSTTCHLGNYCTVIELSSSSCNPLPETGKTVESDCQDSKYDNCDSNDAKSKRTIFVGHPKTETNGELLTNSKESNLKEDRSSLCESYREGSLGNVKVIQHDLCNGEISNHVLSSDLHNYLEGQLLNAADTKISTSGFSSIIVVGDSVPNKPLLNGFLDSSELDSNVQPLSVDSMPEDVSAIHQEDLRLTSEAPSQIEETEDDNDSLDIPVEMDELKGDSDELKGDSDELKGDSDELKEDSDELKRDSDELKRDSDAMKTVISSAFNHFQYWRTPLPTVDAEAINEEIKFYVMSPQMSSREIRHQHRRKAIISQHYVSSANVTSDGEEQVNSESSSNPVPSNEVQISANSFPTINFCGPLYEVVQSCDSSFSNNCSEKSEEIRLSDCYTYTSKEFNLPNLGKTGEPPPDLNNFFRAHDQDIVPPKLLLRYLSMTDAARAQNVDAEIARHCAYSLPAVALTLGRRFWPCLKETYNTLASDMQGFIMQWKVRRTLASSMHQMAVILGSQISARDLLPIFSGFIQDLDEVRIGILQHLAQFLEVLEEKERKIYLPRFVEFLNIDNERNWRFRHILSEQLIQVTQLYDPVDISEHLVPLALVLLRDKVAEVRVMSVRLMAVIIRQMNRDPELTKDFLTKLSEQFIYSSKWLHRQIYVYLCQEFVRENSLSADDFADDALPHLLFLSWDRVANVRLAVARCLACVIWPSSLFSDSNNSHRELVLQAIHPLQSDTDPDVRYFANMVSLHECPCLQHAGALSDLDDNV